MNQDWLDPILFTIGFMQVRWYALSIVLGFLLGALILKKSWTLSTKQLDTFITLQIITALVGSRLIYVFLYHWEYYSVYPWDILQIWKGGMSFHGALLGMGIGAGYFAWKNKISFLSLFDRLVLALVPGIFLGRLGNFINGELYGRVTDSWVGIIFPAGGPFPRHPSQLYEAIFEGPVLFFILFQIHRKQRFSGWVSAGFLGFYGILRFFIEFFREPDAQLGFFLTYFTLGQILCLFMLPLAFIFFKEAQRE